MVCAAAATQVRFDIGSGITVPTQVVFVPMLFALPPAAVPPVVMAGWMGGMLPAVMRRRLPATRMLTAPGNSWFAIGPALVLSVVGVDHPSFARPVLALALAAQFAGDFLSNVVRERLRGGPGVRELARGEVSAHLHDGCRTPPLGLTIAYASVHAPWAILGVLPLFRVMAVFAREREARMDQLIELNDAYRGTAMVLGNVVEADDADTGEHCRGVVALSVQVARELDLSAEQVRNVEFGALLHDVGKIAVPKEIINKPGRLNDEEWAIIKTHTIEGQRLLDTVGGFMRDVGRIVRSSHESWDGSGYPDGLRGERIPIEARIVSACDAFNAMTTTRSYRKAMPAERALAEMTACSGTQFDPAVVGALVEMVTADAAAAINAGRERVKADLSAATLPVRPDAPKAPGSAAGVPTTVAA